VKEKLEFMHKFVLASLDRGVKIVENPVIPDCPNTPRH
jgi:hypothetical protein